jgi:hypothetical protein
MGFETGIGNANDDLRPRIPDLGSAVSGRERAAAASDRHALGVTLCRWLGDRLPYGGTDPDQRARWRRDPVASRKIALAGSPPVNGLLLHRLLFLRR